MTLTWWRIPKGQLIIDNPEKLVTQDVEKQNKGKLIIGNPKKLVTQDVEKQNKNTTQYVLCTII